MLALFIGDDNIKHAFRNDVHIATGSIGTNKFFEENFGFVDNVTVRGGGVELVSDLSNINLEGVVCRHPCFGYIDPNCDRCRSSHLSISEYKNRITSTE